MPSTMERLALALEAAGAPIQMVRDARAGMFDDFESNSPTPITDLIRIAALYGLHDIAERAKNGEFDATKEESEAWANSVTDPEMRAALDSMREEG